VLDVKASLNFALNASEDTSNYTGNFLVANDVNIQIRGFVEAAVGRNYFTWRLSSDVFNVERIDFSRGPNSVLFGVGAPGGIVNTTTKRARLTGKSTDQVQLRVGSWDEHRATLDVSRSAGKKFAVRANVRWQDRESWREFGYPQTPGGPPAALPAEVGNAPDQVSIATVTAALTDADGRVLGRPFTILELSARSTRSFTFEAPDGAVRYKAFVGEINY